jgi:voltage-gated sodium channel
MSIAFGIYVTYVANYGSVFGNLATFFVLLLYVYGMVGWIIFRNHYPDDYGTIGESMLTLFVLLSTDDLDGLQLGK